MVRISGKASTDAPHTATLILLILGNINHVLLTLTSGGHQIAGVSVRGVVFPGGAARLVLARIEATNAKYLIAKSVINKKY
jgi:hypothetical protein